MCGCFSRGLSPPTISDTSGLQVNFASNSRSSRSRPDRSGDLKFPVFLLEMTSVRAMLGSRFVRRWIRLWYQTAVRCWRWYRYGYRYLSLHHLLLEFRKYANIVPCAIGVRGPGLAFLSLMCWTARRAWDKAKLQNRHKQMPRTRKWSVVWRDRHSQKMIFQKDVLNRSSDNVMGCDNTFLSLLGLKMHWAMLKLFGCLAKQAHFFQHHRS